MVEKTRTSRMTGKKNLDEKTTPDKLGWDAGSLKQKSEDKSETHRKKGHRKRMTAETSQAQTLDKCSPWKLSNGGRGQIVSLGTGRTLIEDHVS